MGQLAQPFTSLSAPPVHSAKFARLLGADDPYGWDESGPDFVGAAGYLARTADRSG